MRITPSRAVLLLTASLLAAVAGLRASGSPDGQSTNTTPRATASQAAPEGQTASPKPQAASPEQPVFRTGINFIRVDAIVSDGKGNPVTDLKIEDFEISEDGKAQKPETLRLVKIDATTAPSYTQRTIRTRLDEETAANDETSRIFVFFLDDYAVRRENSMAVRKPLIDFRQHDRHAQRFDHNHCVSSRECLRNRRAGRCWIRHRDPARRRQPIGNTVRREADAIGSQISGQ